MKTKKEKIYFIGIGGIGISALAQYYLAKGYKVSGSDLVSSEITNLLKKKGANIAIGKQQIKNFPKNATLVIYSPAIQKNNPELKEALKLKVKNKKLPILSYPQALGELSKKYFTIAVAGTHGKSTTTAMLGLILLKAKFDPTIILGTKLKEFGGSNFKIGKSQYLVIEACEYQKSFLNYWPKAIVITNIEKEHLDYYKNLNNIIKAFREFAKHLPEKGILVGNKNDKNSAKALNYSFAKLLNIQKFFLKQKIGTQKEAYTLKKILKVPGEHNINNALIALACARALKIPDKISFKALAEFQGSWRRFEIIRVSKKQNKKMAGITIVSDYAHHPTEIEATLKAAKEKFPKREILCVFQPHQYQRTFYLFKDFAKVFRKALKKKIVDKVIITDIFDVAGREKRNLKQKINSEKLVEAIRNDFAVYVAKEKIINYLKRELKGKEIIIIMGAGDIYKLIFDIKKIKN